MKKVSIGKRNLKTALSVFIAIVLHLVLILIDKALGNPGDGFSGLSGFYTPFFAGIAAAYTSHKDYKSSLKQAKIRSVGSIIGGLFGMIIISIVEFLFMKQFVIEDYVLYHLVEYTFVSLGIILLIYLNVKTKQKDATFISCLTYLSVTISIRNGGMEILQFSINRILSTLIGVGIALLVNNIRLINHRNKNVLFISTIDDVINFDDYPLSFTRYKINDLYQKDAKLVLHTRRSGIDRTLFKEIHINKPLILMDGVCIYENNTKDYIYSCDFLPDTRLTLNKYFKEHDYDYFTYIINDLKLVVYHLDLKHQTSFNYYREERKNNKYPFVHADIFDDSDVALYEVVIKIDEIDNIIKDFNDLNIIENIVFKYKKIEDDYIVLTIKPSHSSRSDAISHLPYYDECDYKVMFINSFDDYDSNDKTSFKICLKNAPTKVKNDADYILDSSDYNDVLRLFAKLYYVKNVEKYLNKLKERSLK